MRGAVRCTRVAASCPWSIAVVTRPRVQKTGHGATTVDHHATILADGDPMAMADVVIDARAPQPHRAAAIGVILHTWAGRMRSLTLLWGGPDAHDDDDNRIHPTFGYTLDRQLIPAVTSTREMTLDFARGVQGRKKKVTPRPTDRPCPGAQYHPGRLFVGGSGAPLR